MLWFVEGEGKAICLTQRPQPSPPTPPHPSHFWTPSHGWLWHHWDLNHQSPDNNILLPQMLCQKRIMTGQVVHTVEMCICSFVSVLVYVTSSLAFCTLLHCWLQLIFINKHKQLCFQASKAYNWAARWTFHLSSRLAKEFWFFFKIIYF